MVKKRLHLCLDAVKGLEAYSPGTKEWKQAHCQAFFVILHVLLEAGQGFVNIIEVKSSDGQPDLLLSMDRTKLESVGKPAISDFLKKLQVFKSTGDVHTAKEIFDRYSEVADNGAHPFGKWREVILFRKQARPMMVQANTLIKDDTVCLVDYDATHAGFIRSWSQRFTSDEFADIDVCLRDLYSSDKPHFS